MKSGGDEKVTKQKRRLGLTIPLSLHEKLLDKAEYQGKTINATCLDIFWEYFEEKEYRNSGKGWQQENIEN